MLVDPFGGELRIQASRGLGARAHDRSTQRSGRRVSDWVLREGRPMILNGQVSDRRFDPTASGDRIASALSLPLLAARSVVGVINLARMKPAACFDEDDMRRLEFRLRPLARSLEQTIDAALLRLGWSHALRGVWGRSKANAWVSHRYEASVSWTEGRVRRGDFVERAFHQDGSISLLLGDVAGWGPAALADAMMLRGMFLSMAGPRRCPAEIVQGINDLLVDHGDPLTASLWIAHLLPGGRVLSCVAGMPSPVVVSSSGEVMGWLREGGPPTGGLGGASFAQESVQLLPGDRVVAFSDGVALAGGDEEDPLAAEGVLSAIRDSRLGPISLLARRVRDTALRRTGAVGPTDDLTVVSIGYKARD